ncbi:6621_t:CDS:1, partial [Entrophospora sp. SA101]
AWDVVTPEIISNCWKKAGLLPEENDLYPIEIEQANNLVNEILQEENAVQNLI